ncbi:MAG: hypothetical protein Q4E26_00445 [Prevotellaceae bacterium]|nr:hypothetical protein [Prevotellaceae bacterium]
MKTKNDEDRKVKYIKVLVTEKEKAEIEATAKRCGKSASRFLCERGLGYEPKLHLTEKEISLLESLQTLITELTRFTSVISGKVKGLKDQNLRMQYLSSISVTRPWKSKLDTVLDFLYATISNVNFRHIYNHDR